MTKLIQIQYLSQLRSKSEVITSIEFLFVEGFPNNIKSTLPKSLVFDFIKFSMTKLFNIQ